MHSLVMVLDLKVDLVLLNPPTLSKDYLKHYGPILTVHWQLNPLPLEGMGGGVLNPGWWFVTSNN